MFDKFKFFLAIAVVSFFIGRWKSSRLTAEQATMGADLRGQCVLITGAGTGLGLHSAQVLAQRGAERVLIHTRSEKKSKLRARELNAGLDIGDAEVYFPVWSDLSNANEVVELSKQAAALCPKLHVLLLNAGIMGQPSRERRSMGPVEVDIVMTVNHVNQALLTQRLLPQLRSAGQSRVISVASIEHRQADPQFVNSNVLESEPYSGWSVYGNSKLAQILYYAKFHEIHHKKDGISTFTLHPGVIVTDIVTKNVRLSNFNVRALAGHLDRKTVPQGAATQCWAATSFDAVKKYGGQYLDELESSPIYVPSSFNIIEGQSKVWQTTQALIQPFL